MEVSMLYSLTILFDFITIMLLNMNREYIFIVYSYTIGLIILSNVMKARKITLAMVEGRGFIFYDPVLILLFVIIIYGLPLIYEGLIHESVYALGLSS
jgi:hypothetical protein